MIRIVSLLVLMLAVSAQAQNVTPPTVSLTLENAVEIALEHNYQVRAAELDIATSNAQVREAWGSVMPSVSANASYTRNIVSPNPFAGSDAGGLFEGIALMDWLAYNEQARTDDDPNTEPISLEEYRRLQMEGYENAGIFPSESSNPFAVPNQFQSQVSISQILYSGAAFAAIRGASSLREISQVGLTLQQQQTIHQTRQLFYGALLAQEQADVTRASVERARETVHETSRLVASGTLPTFDRLSAEVELTNLETQLVQVENVAALSLSNLLYQLGLPVTEPLRLEGNLMYEPADLLEFVSAEDAHVTALERRPELRQAELAVDLQGINRDITRASYLPTLSAFANLGYTGTVPDNRTVIRQGGNPDDPFAVTSEERGFFDTSYWNPSVSIGAQLSWNLFDGFQRRYRVQQNTIDIQRAELQLEQATQQVALDVDQAVRNLDSARQRIIAQQENVDRAETAYRYASTRLANGVATQMDVRMASSQLDQARLGYLQAIHDYLVARSDLQRAMGILLPEPATSHN